MLLKKPFCRRVFAFSELVFQNCQAYFTTAEGKNKGFFYFLPRIFLKKSKKLEFFYIFCKLFFKNPLILLKVCYIIWMWEKVGDGVLPVYLGVRTDRSRPVKHSF